MLGAGALRAERSGVGRSRGKKLGFLFGSFFLVVCFVG